MPSKFTAAEREVGTADTAKRRKMPADWFLMPETRKYPWKDSAGKPSKSLLSHAETRAKENGHDAVAKRAHDMQLAHFSEGSNKPKKQGATPAPAAEDGPAEPPAEPAPAKKRAHRWI